jgi:hypothetical protein
MPNEQSTNSDPSLLKAAQEAQEVIFIGLAREASRWKSAA